MVEWKGFDRGFDLYIDGSCVGAGSVFMQADDLGLDKPLTFNFQKTNSALAIQIIQTLRKKHGC